MARLLLLFTLLPLVELYILIRIGERVGFLPTLLGVIAVGLLGAALARREGFRVLRDWREALSQGRMPSEGVLGGMLVLVGCVLLVTPGVLSDFVGLGLLFPPTRRVFARAVHERLERSIEQGSVRVYGGFPPRRAPAGAAHAYGGGFAPRPVRGEVIDVDGEVVEVDGRKTSR